MADVTLRSREQILGELVRTIINNTDLSDIAPGSSVATLLEAISSSQYQIEVSTLKILESSDLESLNGADLDKKAEGIKLPNGIGGFGRKPAAQANGSVTIGSSFDKISSKLYAGKPAPFSGSTILYLENASEFSATGQIYIGRNTVDRFEGPISYTSVVDNGSFWTVTLSVPLTKNHLQSDLVVLAQGGDRTVPAGTTVEVESNSDSPPVQFTTALDLLIPDGEAEGVVNVACTQFGEIGNALAGSITQFSSEPFPGATVINNSSFRNGRSAESDEDLRQRIKTYPSTLSRGTKVAILAAIQGATDPVSGRTIQNAVVLDPVEPGDFARVYIDDNTGLEPSFGTQPYELLLKSATGQETRFRTAQFPVTPAIIEGANRGPFALQASYTITVQVDEIVETYQITPSNYSNLNSATAYEVVRDLNSQSNIVGFRTLDNGRRLVMMDLSGRAEIMSVQSGTLQEILGFPLAVVRPIFLYQNSEIKSFRGRTATLETRPKNSWNVSAADVTNVRVRVDGVTQTFSVTNSDFVEFGTSISTATVDQWATVFSRKIAGVKFSVSGQIIVWSTWQTFSSSGSLEILETREDGTPAGWVGDNKIWLPVASGGELSAAGAPKDFSFNRFTGEINLLNKPDSGDTIEIGSRTTRAHIRSKSTSNGLYALDPEPSTVGNSRIVVAFDGDFAVRSVTVPTGATLTPTQPDASGATNVIRLTANVVDTFLNAEIDDWMYLVQDQSVVPAWGPAVEGFYKIKNKGNNLHASDQNFTGLSAATEVTTGLTAITTLDSDVVTVVHSDHGYKTGDLITVSTANPIGGISAGNLSQVDTPIIVLSSNRYTYVAGASATSDDTGALDSTGVNIVAVTQTSHGFEDGAVIDVTAGVAIGGISSGDLSVSGATIDVIDADTYQYRAAAAATSTASGNINISYLADAWIEFEVSSPQLTDWTALLSAAQSLSNVMLFVFRSTATPQLVDFGNSVSTANVDEIVSAINSQITAGSAVKISPQELEIRSNDYVGGTCAVLAVVGNAINLVDPAISDSLQAHIANSSSGDVGTGVPVIVDVITPTASSSGYGTRTYLKVDKDLTDILDETDNPAIESDSSISTYPEGFQNIWLTGRQAGLTARVYNNQTTAPFAGIMRGENMVRPLNTSDTLQTTPDSLDRYANYSIRMRDVPLNNYDRLVFEMDLDPTDKTVSILMSKIAQIQDIDAITGSGKGQVISFRLKDPEDNDRPFFDAASVYKDFDFTDFKILTKNVGLYREQPASDRALVLRSVAFGAPARLRLSIRYPEQADQADFVITHTSNYREEEAQLNLIVSLPSGSEIIPGTVGSGVYKVTATANGTLYDWRIMHPLLNQNNDYVVGDVLNLSGVTGLAGSYKITASTYGDYTAVTADTTNGSSVVVVTQAAHGFEDGDLINVIAGASIGGISAVNLSQTATEVTYINANQFSYVAGANATSTDTGSLDSIVGGSVTVIAPGSGGLAPSAVYDAAQAPIRTWPLVDKTWEELATAITDYYPDSPVATGEAIGTDFIANPIAEPTYVAYPNASAYTGSDMSGAFNHHSFDTKMSGSAGIWQYDSSVPAANGIKATVQTDESIFPTTTDASGTVYNPINEEVIIVPTNSKTISDWLLFKASSSLNILANVERIDGDGQVQVSSKADGSDGAVRVTGVSANQILTSVVGNASIDGDASKVSILNADARPMLRNHLVRVQNSISTDILRSYRLVPTGSSVTAANTTGINNYFRSTNAIKYIRVNASTGRLIFYRNGMGPTQTEPLDVDNEITLTDLGSGLVQVTGAQAGGGAGTGRLSARVGDMMYIQPSSPFAVDARCPAVDPSGVTDGTNPEYMGYPVVHVIDDNNIVVIAPNISTFGTTTLTSATDLVFLPAIWNEKNIQTNHAAGAKFDAVINDNKFYYLIKNLGNGLVSLWLQNSASEATDDMLLDTMSVNTDDYVVLGDGFDPANQGTFKLVAHNGRNHIVYYNDAGGTDELVDPNGDRKWRVGPVETGLTRSLRIISGDSVRIGDKLRISTPTDLSQWFNSSFFGSWTITGIGVQALDYSGDLLPHDTADGSFDQAFIAPYVEFTIPNAPVAITDSNGDPVDAFLIGANTSAIGFTEGEPFTGYRMIAGHAVSSSDPELANLFLTPRMNTQKMSSTFGTSIEALNKIGFAQQTFQGIDGYKIFTGPVQLAHRIIDGLPQNPVLYPGVKAAGATVEVNTPLIKSIQVSLQVRPKDGISLNSITDLIKSTVETYINNLGVGKPVVISEIIRIVQGLPGVFSVTVIDTNPDADGDRIVSGEIEKPFVLDIERDISVG